MDKIKCPLDISMSIGSNGQLKCPLDICMSNGSIGSRGPLDILPLPSHRPATCMGSMPTYDVIQVNLFTVQTNVQWTYSCPLDPMDKIKCPLDISMSIGFNGQRFLRWWWPIIRTWWRWHWIWWHIWRTMMVTHLGNICAVQQSQQVWARKTRLNRSSLF
jgi:hypothetical protein